MASNEKNKEIWAKVVAQAWADELFKARLLSNPSQVLKENGAELPEGITLRIIEDKPKEKTLVLPPNPGENVSENDLKKIHGGYGGGGGCS